MTTTISIVVRSMLAPMSARQCGRDAFLLHSNVPEAPCVPMNEATVPQQIAHLEAMASTIREDLEEARAGLLAKPSDERLAKQVAALEGLLKGVLTKVERLKRKDDKRDR